MSFITSRKGSLLLAALLVLTLLVYLLFHLLAPRVVQSTDDAYVHADFTLVAPKVAGFVQDVLVEDNQPVKAGQLLARLDDRDFRTALAAAEADVLGAEANLANAEANLQRQQAQVGLGEDQSLLGLVRALPGTDFLARTPAATAHVGIELTDIDARTFQAFPLFRRGPQPVLARHFTTGGGPASRRE